MWANRKPTLISFQYFSYIYRTLYDEDSMLILGLDSKVFNPNLSDNSKHKTPSFYYIQGIPKLVK